jgi:hypothetical protein
VATTTTTNSRSVGGRLLGACLALAGVVESGCSRQAPPPPAPVAGESEPKTPSRALLDYAPAAGLRWLVIGRPSRLAEAPDLEQNLALIFEQERLDAFAHATGIHLDRLPLGAVAGYDLGTLYLGELEKPEAALVRERFSSKLVEGGIAHKRQSLHRIVGTTAAGAVRALVTVDERYLAFATGDVTLARVVEAYAENRLRSPTVLRGAGLRELPPLGADALIAFLAPGPFSNEWGGAAGGIVARAHALGIEARRSGAGRLRASLTLVGEWDDSAAALQQLELAWSNLRDGPTGQLLGLHQTTHLEARSDLQILTLSADLEVGPLARGLRDATSSDVREILELDGAHPGTAP